jgi:hypothetical protein
MNFQDQWLPIGAFGGVCVAGLIGAFIGLAVSSFWYDELYTAWVIGTDSSLADVARRATTDVHPPLYYFSIFGFSKIAGTSDEAMRLFSTIWATAAIVLFITATGRAFSLPARLFGAALAMVSNFWFYQAQNARFYSLGFFIATAILAISIVLLKPRDLQEQQAKWRIALLFGLMLFASFMHFYLMYLSLAVLIVIALLEPRLRVVMGVFALTLITLVFLYLKIVIGTYAQFRIEHSWMGSGYSWYLYQLNAARQLMVNKWTLLALAICAGAWLLGLVLRRGAPRPEQAPTASSTLVALGPLQLRIDPVAALVFGVPLIILAGGIVSSILISPNFQDRNFLVCAPFLWGAFAKLYDAGVGALQARPRLLANSALALAVFAASPIVLGRTLPRNTAVREAAHRILDFKSCKGQIVPVVDGTSTQWTKPGYLETITPAVFGRYLDGFAVPTHLYRTYLAEHRLPADLRAEIQRRVDGQGCPVLLWYGHRGPASNIPIATSELLAAVDRRQAAPAVRSEFFSAYNYGLDRSRSEFGIFILYLDRGAKPAGG